MQNTGTKRSVADVAVEHFIARGLKSDHSRRAYRQEWSRLRAWLGGEGVPPTRTKRSDVERYVRERAEGVSLPTAVRTLAIVRSLLGAVSSKTRTRRNPAARVHLAVGA